MSTVHDIERAIRALPPQDLAALRDWFAAFDAEMWDRQTGTGRGGWAAGSVCGRGAEGSRRGPLHRPMTHRANPRFWACYQAPLIDSPSREELVSNDREPFDPARALATNAAHLNAINVSAECPVVFYEIMSGALVWSDETTKDTPTEAIWALRFIRAFRTGLMTNKPREELRAFWDYGQSLFPQWIGFRPERSQPTPEILALYRRENVRVRMCLREMERGFKFKMADGWFAASSLKNSRNIGHFDTLEAGEMERKMDAEKAKA